MLTFCFSGADGTMTVSEMLTSGMVGKPVAFEFSEEWTGLAKTAVFSAGNVCRDAVVNGNVAIIPAEVLERPMQQLYVGVYGVSRDGDLVIPTVRAKGPRIFPGACPSGDPGTNPDLAIWAQLMVQIGELSRLNTQAKEDLVSAINELYGICGTAGEGISNNAKQLLIGILRNGVYTSDQAENISALESALNDGTVETCSVISYLTNVTGSNTAQRVLNGGAYSNRLTAEEGYVLTSVNVTMGGVDITSEVCADGMILIPAVTGEVVITAWAELDILVPAAERVAMGAVSYVSGKLQLNAANSMRATVVPVGQYLTKGASYGVGFTDELSSTYAFGVMVFVASGTDRTFEYVAGADKYYDTVTGCAIDSGWQATAYDFTATEDNMVLAMNFKRLDGAAMSESDYVTLFEHLIFEVDS